MKGFTNRKERWVVLNVVCIDIEVGEWYCACVETMSTKVRHQRGTYLRERYLDRIEVWKSLR